MSPKRKRYLLIFQHTPYQSGKAQDAIDASLAASIFDQEVTTLHIGDGIFQAIPNQSPKCQSAIEKQISSFAMYDIEKQYICQNSLIERGINPNNLNLPQECLSSEQISDLLAIQDVILSF